MGEPVDLKYEIDAEIVCKPSQANNSREVLNKVWNSKLSIADNETYWHEQGMKHGARAKAGMTEAFAKANAKGRERSIVNDDDSEVER